MRGFSSRRSALLSLILLGAFALPVRAEEGAGPAGAGLDRMTATRERPLFVPSRHAPVAPPPPPPPVAEPDPPALARPVPPNATLIGIILGGDRPFAVLMVDGNTLRLREGEDLDGWRLAGLKARGASLERDGERVELELRPSTGLTPPVAPP